MSSLSASFSSSSEPELSFKYDVCLTFFKGLEEGVRTFLENFLSHFGFKTFFYDFAEDSKLEMIPSCRIVVVVISPEFVMSAFCIQRLVDIMSGLNTVLPFFYGLSQNGVLLGLPIHVSNHLQRVDEGYSDRHQSAELAAELLAQLGSLLMCFSLSDELGDQEAVNNLIVNSISQVGVQPRVKKLLHRLGLVRKHETDTIIIGIWGVGGIGKTTIAKFMYDTIGGLFNCRSFLANIKDVWEKSNGQFHLQKQLLSDVPMNDMKQGPYRKAFIVLDDVNEVGQFTQLCGNREQFGKGSLIFITTRNKGLFDDFVDMSYEVEKLGDHESLQVFAWHAFKTFYPPNDFVNLSRKIVTLCDGLPLILEVIGSFLHNKTKSKWKKVLNKLKNVPSGQIQHKLKISIDFLTDSERKLFSHIACSHVSQSKSDVTHLFKGSGFPIEMGMQVLIERMLVKVVNDKIHMHDLLQEMGREITPNKPKFTYIHDVFLSFRGEDMRKSFATHLYVALKQAGVEAFMDEEGIARGAHISDSLLRAIECSRISIIIFSKNYAGSSWCLQELEKVMECYETTSQEVFPIFYDVQPSDVRKQQNTFGKVLERLIMRPSSSKGKKLTSNVKRVLTEAANLSGWDMQNYREQWQ